MMGSRQVKATANRPMAHSPRAALIAIQVGASSQTCELVRTALYRRHPVFESEADVLHITPAQLREDLRQGQKVSDLAKDRGMTKDQFAAKLAITVKPRLEALVDKKEITQAQADKVLDRISKGYVPFWDGLHRPATATK